MNEILMCGTDPVGQLYKDTKAEATSIAPIEVSPTESSHNVGTHIMYGGIRYKVTSSISVGDTLTIGENIVAENIESNIVYSNGVSVKDMLNVTQNLNKSASGTKFDVSYSEYTYGRTSYVTGTVTPSSNTNADYLEEVALNLSHLPYEFCMGANNGTVSASDRTPKLYTYLNSLGKMGIGGQSTQNRNFQFSFTYINQG